MTKEDMILVRAAGWLAAPEGESKQETINLVRALVARVKNLTPAHEPGVRRMSRMDAQLGFDAIERAYWKSVQIVDGCDPKHTTEDDFQHFLSYSGKRGRNEDDLRLAYYAGADVEPPTQAVHEPHIYSTEGPCDICGGQPTDPQHTPRT